MENQENLEDINHEIDRVLDISLAERKNSNSDNSRYCWVCFANDGSIPKYPYFVL